MLFLPLAAALSLNTLPGRVPGLSERERLAATLSLRDTTTQRVETRGVDADGAFAFAVSDGEYVLALDAARAELPWSYLVRVEAGEVDVHILPPNSALAAVGPAQPLPLEIKATHPAACAEEAQLLVVEVCVHADRADLSRTDSVHLSAALYPR